MVLTLYKLDASPPARAVLMTIEALKIPDVEYVDVNTLEREHLTEEYLKMNPQHTIPTLKDDGFVIWDSHAIVGYLVSAYGENDLLYPTDPKKRALVDQRLHFDCGILFPALRGAIERIAYNGETSYRPEALDKIESAYDVTNKLLSTSTWMAGEELTLADLCCVATISSCHVVLPMDKDRYPTLWAWLQRCAELPYYKAINEPGLEALDALLKSRLE